MTTSGLQLKADFTSLTRAAADCAIPLATYNSAMAKKITLKEIGDMLTHVVKHMATKDDLADPSRRLKHCGMLMA